MRRKCEVTECSYPAVRKVRTPVGGSHQVSMDNGREVITQSEILYAEHWYCKFHAQLIESGH